MKPPILLAIACSAVFSLGLTAQAADSKHTADYLLSSPAANDGQAVTLDVAFVSPVHWQSPLPEVAFFHAMTADRSDRRPGGEILVVVPAANSAAFAKKYGTDFKGRAETTALKGVFLAAGGGEGHHPKTWIIDATDGLLQKAIADKKLDLPPDAGMGGGAGGPGGPGGQGGHHRPQN